MKKLILGLGMGFIVALQGCATMPEESSSVLDHDPALQALQKSAEEVARAFNLMASIEQGTSSPPAMPKPSDSALLQLINLPYWTGPIEKAVESIASQIGYQYRVLGRPKSVETVVSVDARQRPAYEVLQSIGLQGGKEAGIRVDTRNREIMVIYQ